MLHFRSITLIAKVAFLTFSWGVAGAFSPPRPPHVASPSTALKMSAFQLDPSETAFVFIEYQHEFTTHGGKLHDAVKDCMDATNMLETSSKTLHAARSAGCTIIHCPIGFDAGHNEISKSPYGILQGVKEGAAFTNGEWGSELCEVMKPARGDLIVKGKSGLCGFMSTNLDFLLSQHGTKSVVLAGL
jgi:ureidoacrylate peracid hydrolase